MANQKKVLILIGSPKPKNSTSASITKYLENKLEQALQVGVLNIRKELKTSEGRGMLVETFQQSKTIILIAPLYVDSLPAPVTRFLELISENRLDNSREQSFIAIMNAGFPEAVHNETALTICENFARENKLQWAGGLPIGMGGMISGAPLQKLGGMTQKLTGALDLTAEAIIGGEALPEEAIKMAATPFMPHWLYRLMGNIGWKMQARKFRVGNKINSRPDCSVYSK